MLIHQVLNESSLVYTTRNSTTEGATSEIQLIGLKLLFDAPADVQVRFVNDVMQAVSFTFTQPPALDQVIQTFTERFGQPRSKTISDVAYQESRVVWETRADHELLKTTVVETQGNLNIHFDYRKTSN